MKTKKSIDGLKNIGSDGCIGVFSGGGMRGIAFAGAYQAAIRAGIRFKATIGLSSGSIIAALIAADIEPAEIVERLLDKEFKSLLGVPEPPRTLSKLIATKLFNKYRNNLFDIINYQLSLGTYSSKPIETWLNDILMEKVGHRENNEYVTFKDLKIPLLVVSADLVTKRSKLWYNPEYGTTSVAYAVRTSCSIPFFYQPVNGIDTFYVDGGLFGGLPIYAVKKLKLPKNTPILCFRLIQRKDSPGKVISNGKEMIDALVQTVLDGGTLIHLDCSPNCGIIDIDTASYSTLDFDISREGKDDLLKRGNTAFKVFLDNNADFCNRKAVAIQPSIPLEEYREGLVAIQPSIPLKEYREGLLEDTADLISRTNNALLIFAGNLSWLEELHIHLLNEILDGKEIKILCEKHTEEYSIDAIKAACAIGAQVGIIEEACPIRAIIKDPGDADEEMITIEKGPVHGTLLDRRNNESIFISKKKLFDKLWNKATIQPISKVPEFESISEERTVKALKDGVPQYKKLQISYEDIAIKGLLPLSKYMEYSKLARVEKLNRLLLRDELVEMNRGAAIRIIGSPWLITPPIVEKIKNKTVIIDGNHRIFAAIQNNIKQMKMIIVNNIDGEFPSVPLHGWSDVTLLSEKQPRESRYISYNKDNFRTIRQAFMALAKDSEY